MTEQTIEEAEAQQETPVVDQTPVPSQREPHEIVPFKAGGDLAALIPQTPEEYARMARLLINAGCVPASYAGDNFEETRSKLIIGLMKSIEIGVPPLTGLNGIMIINNRPAVWGDLAVSLIHRSGQLTKMEVRRINDAFDHNLPLKQWPNNFGYRVMMWRKGHDMPYIGEFTVGDAKRAGLWENTRKKPWIYYPLDMLFNRARARAMRDGFADALHGMGIVEEERDIIADSQAPSASDLLSDDAPDEASDDAGDDAIEDGDFPEVHEGDEQ